MILHGILNIFLVVDVKCIPSQKKVPIKFALNINDHYI